MSEMVDKVAEAILDALPAFVGEGASDDPLMISYIDCEAVDLREIARAAIEAMREPTEQMVEAASPPKGIAGGWSAMIDAALKDAPTIRQRDAALKGAWIRKFVDAPDGQ
jgi:hypothetical protein